MAAEIIKVKNLSSTFDQNKILDNISFTAYENKITVILGKSGCGKTMVMKHLIGLYPVQEGEILIMGKKLEVNDNERMRERLLKMGVLFQNGALMNSLTIAENVAIPLEQHTNLPVYIIKDLVRVKLNLVELAQAGELLPSQLAGGMRKRAALARAISLDPPLLFCDEPSAGLDPVTLASLDSLILKLKEYLGMSIILITHEVSSISRLADRIVFLDKGTVIYEGGLKSALESGLSPIKDFFTKGKDDDSKIG
jgi:phospholipid/cholesterol/gamma-HCH transport system ATP-binding protein